MPATIGQFVCEYCNLNLASIIVVQPQFNGTLQNKLKSLEVEKAKDKNHTSLPFEGFPQGLSKPPQFEIDSKVLLMVLASKIQNQLQDLEGHLFL